MTKRGRVAALVMAGAISGWAQPLGPGDVLASGALKLRCATNACPEIRQSGDSVAVMAAGGTGLFDNVELARVYAGKNHGPTASNGIFNLPNNESIASRNVQNTGDVCVAKVTDGNVVQIGCGGDPVAIPSLASAAPNSFIKVDAQGNLSAAQVYGGGSGSGGWSSMIKYAKEFTATFCQSGTCHDDRTTLAKPVVIPSGALTMYGCMALFYGAQPSSTITIDVRKNSTSPTSGVSLLGTVWAITAATVGVPVQFGGDFTGLLGNGDQVAIYMTGTSGEGLVVTCGAH